MNVMQNEKKLIFDTETSPDDEILSKTIEWMRFPLATAVIFTGVTPVSDVFGVAVPCFFLLYGYRFFSKLNDGNRTAYADKIKSRIGTLMVPYLLWNVIAVCADASLEFVRSDGNLALYFKEIYDKGLWRIFWNVNEWNTTVTDLFGRATPSYGPYLAPLCFLRDLIVMVILSPLIYHAVKFGGMFFVVLSGVMYYTKTGFVAPGAEQFSTALFFFGFGAWFAVNGRNPIVALRRGRFYWMLLAIVCLLLSTCFDGCKTKDYVYPLFVLSGVIATINVVAFFMERGALKVVSTLSKASFFVYATHGILILELTGRLFDKIFPSDHVVVLLTKFFCVPTICALVCLCAYCLMRRATPKLLNLLTGNR